MVISGYVRKLKSMRRRYFVLYAGEGERPATVEYYENEKKWRQGTTPPSKVVELKSW